MPKAHRVQLSATERAQLQQLISTGAAAARVLTHARILLKADEGEAGPAWTDAAIAQALEVSIPTVARVRHRWGQGGLEGALPRRPPGRCRSGKLDGEKEAHLIALTCSEPPQGHSRWSLRLLAGRMVQLQHVEQLSHETVRRTLQKTNSNRG
jgi:transposase